MLLLRFPQYLYLIAACLISSPAGAQGAAENPAYSEPRGPIPIRNGRAFNQLVLQFVPESPDTLSSGKTKLGLQFDIFNNLLIPNPRGSSVEEDYEEQRLLLSWRKGLGHGSEMGVFLPIRYRNGGFMDGLLREWHGLWGIPNRTRDDRLGRRSSSDFRSRLKWIDSQGNALVDAKTAFGLGDVSATWKREIGRRTPRSALAARIGIKAPTGNPGQVLGSGSFDAGISLDGRYNVRRTLILFGNVGRVLSGGATRVPHAQRWVTDVMAAAEVRLNNRDSYLFQMEGNTLVVRTGNVRADEPQSTFTFGYQRVLDRHLVFHGSFSENGDWSAYSSTFFGGVGPDFTVSLGLTWRP